VLQGQNGVGLNPDWAGFLGEPDEPFCWFLISKITTKNVLENGSTVVSKLLTPCPLRGFEPSIVHVAMTTATRKGGSYVYCFFNIHVSWNTHARWQQMNVSNF
jgi:hypothetical protein